MRTPLASKMLRVIGQMDLTPCNGCDGCGLRCTAGVPMSREEYENVKAYVERAPNREEVVRVVAQEKIVDLGDDVQVRMCRFRDMERGRCAIYPVRPLVCRLLGHVEWMPCPIKKVERIVPTEEALELMRAYAVLERHSFEEWESIKRQRAGVFAGKKWAYGGRASGEPLKYDVPSALRPVAKETPVRLEVLRE